VTASLSTPGVGWVAKTACVAVRCEPNASVEDPVQLLESVEVPGADRRRIELWQGDLTDLAPEHGVDALVVSAFPDDYLPTTSSMIGALDRSGVSVAELAEDKDIDLRETMSCWLSQDLGRSYSGLGFHRILVFEPLRRGEPPELVGDIFRSLMPITTVRPQITSIALPIVAAGNMGYTIPAMLDPLLDAAAHWLAAGLPLDRVLIVVYRESDIEEARQVFLGASAALLEPMAPPVASDYDIFISYSRQNVAECDALVEALREAQPDIRIFVDRHAIDPGAAWQVKIFESLDRCDTVVAMMSPDYLASKMCQEEYAIAMARSRNLDRDLIFPVYLYSADLPTYMMVRNYVDCREGEPSKIKEVAGAVLRSIR
jgi:hypothetical protein